MKPKEEIILNKDQLNSLNKLHQHKDFNSLEEFRILFFFLFSTTTPPQKTLILGNFTQLQVTLENFLEKINV